MDLKDYFIDYRRCMLIYLAFIIVFIFAMFTQENFAHPENELIFIVLVSIIGLISIYYSYRNKLEYHKVALVLIIIFGLLMVFFTPPFSFIDEPAHYTRSELITEGSLYPEFTENGIYVEDYYFVFQQSYYGTTILTENNHYDNPITSHKGYWEWTTSSVFYSYLISALGILLAKLLHLPAIWALYLSRIANLALYGAVAYYMIKIIPKYKLPLAIFATMPLCISQVSSVSYDAFTLTFVLIILTYFVKMYCGEVNRKNLAIFLISVLLISLIKPHCLMLLFLTLLIPFNDKRQMACVGLSILVITLLTIFSVSSSFITLFSPTYAISHNPSVPANTSIMGQAMFLLSSPLNILAFFKNVIISIPDLFILKSSFFHYGDYKGMKLINIMYVLFFIAFSLFHKIDIEFNKKERIITALVFLIAYIGIYAVFYLNWTTVGMDGILGVQSRYLLPIIWLLPLIFNTKYKKIENKEIYIFTFIIICLTGLFLLPITHFY